MVEHIVWHIPGDSLKNFSGLSTKNDLIILSRWPFYLINYMNSMTICTLHFELLAGKPKVKLAAGSCLVIMVSL